MIKLLKSDTFAHIVEHTPLIAIDLIIKNSMILYYYIFTRRAYQ